MAHCSAVNDSRKQLGRRPRGLRLGWLLLVPLLLAPLAAQSGYQACLGCAEHEAMRTRWHRPFLIELETAGLTMFTHFEVEGEAQRMGLCESDVLIRSSLAVGGCHAYSAKRAWLIEAPLEFVAFTSPAWGLERRGHPRWAMLLEAVPMVYHAWSAHQTVHAIHQWQRLQFLYGPTPFASPSAVTH